MATRPVRHSLSSASAAATALLAALLAATASAAPAAANPTRALGELIDLSDLNARLPPPGTPLAAVTRTIFNGSCIPAGAALLPGDVIYSPSGSYALAFFGGGAWQPTAPAAGNMWSREDPLWGGALTDYAGGKSIFQPADAGGDLEQGALYLLNVSARPAAVQWSSARSRGDGGARKFFSPENAEFGPPKFRQRPTVMEIKNSAIARSTVYHFCTLQIDAKLVCYNTVFDLGRSNHWILSGHYPARSSDYTKTHDWKELPFFDGDPHRFSYWSSGEAGAACQPAARGGPVPQLCVGDDGDVAVTLRDLADAAPIPCWSAKSDSGHYAPAPLLDDSRPAAAHAARARAPLEVLDSAVLHSDAAAPELLLPGASLFSPNNKFELRLQADDGNLVLYELADDGSGRVKTANGQPDGEPVTRWNMFMRPSTTLKKTEFLSRYVLGGEVFAAAMPRDAGTSAASAVSGALPVGCALLQQAAPERGSLACFFIANSVPPGTPLSTRFTRSDSSDRARGDLLSASFADMACNAYWDSESELRPVRQRASAPVPPYTLEVRDDGTAAVVGGDGAIVWSTAISAEHRQRSADDSIQLKFALGVTKLLFSSTQTIGASGATSFESAFRSALNIVSATAKGVLSLHGRAVAYFAARAGGSIRSGGSSMFGRQSTVSFISDLRKPRLSSAIWERGADKASAAVRSSSAAAQSSFSWHRSSAAMQSFSASVIEKGRLSASSSVGSAGAVGSGLGSIGSSSVISDKAEAFFGELSASSSAGSDVIMKNSVRWSAKLAKALALAKKGVGYTIDASIKRGIDKKLFKILYKKLNKMEWECVVARPILLQRPCKHMHTRTRTRTHTFTQPPPTLLPRRKTHAAEGTKEDSSRFLAVAAHDGARAHSGRLRRERRQRVRGAGSNEKREKRGREDPAAELAEGWEEAYDKSRLQKYWLNAATGDVVWSFPSKQAAADAAALEAELAEVAASLISLNVSAVPASQLEHAAELTSADAEAAAAAVFIAAAESRYTIMRPLDVLDYILLARARATLIPRLQQLAADAAVAWSAEHEAVALAGVAGDVTADRLHLLQCIAS